MGATADTPLASEGSTRSAAADNSEITVVRPLESPRLTPEAARSLLRLLRHAAERHGAAT